MTENEENPDNEILETILSLTTECFYRLELGPGMELACTWFRGAQESITGYSDEELKAKGGISAIVHPEDKGKFDLYRTSVIGGTEKTFEYRILSSDGQLRWLRDRSRPLKDDDPGQITGIVGAISDITEFKMEQNSVAPSQDYYKKIFDAAGDAISIVDPETEIVLDVNAKACEMYGFTREEFIGLSFVTLTQQKVRGQMEIKKFFSTGVSPIHRTVHYTKDGKELQLEIRGSIIQLDGKRALMSIHRDVSGREE